MFQSLGSAGSPAPNGHGPGEGMPRADVQCGAPRAHTHPSGDSLGPAHVQCASTPHPHLHPVRNSAGLTPPPPPLGLCGPLSCEAPPNRFGWGKVNRMEGRTTRGKENKGGDQRRPNDTTDVEQGPGGQAARATGWQAGPNGSCDLCPVPVLECRGRILLALLGLKGSAAGGRGRASFEQGGGEGVLDPKLGVPKMA